MHSQASGSRYEQDFEVGFKAISTNKRVCTAAVRSTIKFLRLLIINLHIEMSYYQFITFMPVNAKVPKKGTQIKREVTIISSFMLASESEIPHISVRVVQFPEKGKNFSHAYNTVF